jgi:hypothetical protein
MAKEQGKYTQKEYTPTTTIKNELQKEIVAQALDWLFKKDPGVTWEEAGENRGKILDTLKKEFGFPVKAEAWCAQFAWGVVNQACKVVGAKNILPKTAGARLLRDMSINTNTVICKPLPEIGSVMYRKSLEPSASGHVGIVVKIDPDGTFYTIEGNLQEKVAMTVYSADRYFDKNSGQYWLLGVPFTFMWTGRFPYSGKARPQDVEVITKTVSDTTRTQYFVGGSTANPNESSNNSRKKKRKSRKEFR